jgi:hypothetical protein
MITKIIPSNKITDECWAIQFQGIKACKACKYRTKRTCGGQTIRKTGKNAKGFTVPLAELVPKWGLTIRPKPQPGPISVSI